MNEKDRKIEIQLQFYGKLRPYSSTAQDPHEIGSVFQNPDSTQIHIIHENPSFSAERIIQETKNLTPRVFLTMDKRLRSTISVIPSNKDING